MGVASEGGGGVHGGNVEGGGGSVETGADREEQVPFTTSMNRSRIKRGRESEYCSDMNNNEKETTTVEEPDMDFPCAKRRRRCHDAFASSSSHPPPALSEEEEKAKSSATIDDTDDDAIDKAFMDFGILQRCTHRVHRFSPGQCGSQMMENGDKCAANGHWSLILGNHVAPSTVTAEAVHSACREGNSNALRSLAQHVDVNEADETGWTPMHTAFVHNQEAAVRALYAHGASATDTVGNACVCPAWPFRPLLWAGMRGEYNGGDGDDWTLQQIALLDNCATEDEAAEHLVKEIMIRVRNSDHVWPVTHADLLERQNNLFDRARTNIWNLVCNAVDKFGPQVLTTTVFGVDERLGRFLCGGWSSPFAAVVALNCPMLCRACIELGADVNATIVHTDGRATPLAFAALFGALECAQILLNHGAHVSVGSCTLPLSIACTRGDVDMTRLLLLFGASPNQRCDFMDFPLVCACDNTYYRGMLFQSVGGSADCCELLLRHGANPNVVSFNGNTPLHLSCGESLCRGDDACTKLLLRHGADPNRSNNRGVVPLHVAVDEACKTLDVHLRFPPPRQVEPLNCRSAMRNIALLARHPRTNPVARNETGMTALHVACKHQKYEVCLKLLECAVEDKVGEMINFTNDLGATPLHVLCGERAKPEPHALVELLVTNGANVDIQNLRARTPLMLACMHDLVLCVRVLLERGHANARYVDENGDTALTIACRRRHVMCVRLLCEHGADVDDALLRSELNTLWDDPGFGETHLVLCEMFDRQGITGKWPTQVVNVEGWTPLHAAAFFGRVHCLCKLLERGADVHAHDELGRTPTEVARDGTVARALTVAAESGNWREAETFLFGGLKIE